jgi:hypothetical protein
MFDAKLETGYFVDPAEGLNSFCPFTDTRRWPAVPDETSQSAASSFAPGYFCGPGSAVIGDRECCAPVIYGSGIMQRRRREKVWRAWQSQRLHPGYG